jgi:hypothetical protein
LNAGGVSGRKMKLVRKPPTFYRRLKKGFPAGVTCLLFLGGLAGIGFRLVPSGTSIPTSIVLGVAAFCIISSIIAAFIKGHISHLPNEIIFDEEEDKSYTAQYATQQSLSEAVELTKPFYRHEFIPASTAELWRKKNPEGFVSIYNAQNEMCACFGVLALEHSFMQQFIKGRISDTELTADDILDPLESKKATEIYISGVVVRDPDSMAGHRRACVMFWAMAQYLKSRYGFKKNRSIYALAVSKTSENLLKKSNFAIASHESQRKDKLNLYMLSLSKANLESIKLRIGDCSGMCRCAFSADK